MPPTAPITEIVPPYRSSGLAIGTAAIAATTAVLVVLLAVDPRISPTARASVATAGLALVAALAVAAQHLARLRGGLFVDATKRHLGVGLMSPAHTWWLPIESLRGVSTAHVVRDGDATFTAALELRCGAALVLAETAERDVADEIARLVADATALPDCDPLHSGSSPPQGESAIGVRRGAALQPLVTSFGLAAALLGGVLLTVAGTSPILAILFAPGLALLGLVLLTASAVKRFAREELVHRGGLWTHRWRLFGRRFASRTYAAPHPRWRLRAEPIRGVCLELATPEGTLVIGSGATPLSRDGVADLLAIVERYTAA